MLSMRNLSIYVTNGYEKKKHKNAIDKIFIIFFFCVWVHKLGLLCAFGSCRGYYILI